MTASLVVQHAQVGLSRSRAPRTLTLYVPSQHSSELLVPDGDIVVISPRRYRSRRTGVVVLVVGDIAINSPAGVGPQPLLRPRYGAVTGADRMFCVER